MLERCIGSTRGGALTGFLALSIIALLPIVACALPPILDYPNHMARMHILASSPLNADLARYYKIAWSPIPDLAADSIVPLLARIMPVMIAMRVFLAIVLIALAGGAIMLNRVAYQRWSPWPLTAFLLLYNRMLLWGFINYLAGLALALWALAAWLLLERRPFAVRLAAGLGLSTIIYLAHLAAFGCYALAVLALAAVPFDGARVTTGARLKRLLSAAVTLTPPVILFLISPTSGAPASIAYGNPLRKLDLPVSIFDDYSRVFDGATFAVLLIAVIVGLARGGIRVHRHLRWCVAAIIAAFLLLPSQFLSASGIDHRLPIAIAFLFVASSDWSAIDPWRRKIIAVALLALFIVRMAVVLDVWIQADREYARLLPAFDAIAPGAAVAVAAPAEAVQAGGIPLLHFPTIAVIKRDAFAPSLFAAPYQQPVRFTPYAARLAAKDPPDLVWRLLSQDKPVNLAGYDDLMIIDPPDNLDIGKLPGMILFSDPRLILVRLTPQMAEPER